MKTLTDFQKLVDAEDFLSFFDIPYDQTAVNVNRLHILKMFSGAIAEVDEKTGLTETEKLTEYKTALESAYQTFLTSSAQEQKVFPVFQQEHKDVVKLTEITAE
ncbi:MAG: nitrogenase-stabilizing/protective protein NifW [Okeania sp. SIO3H1]|uniref:nitrogenase-stabilizing/protective protein NifW n=1 Tax=Okeania sp. SIO1I7 TaxID=2607772 RepID=UPI0013C8978B|nr:nitrogenase-stabilizing/protective protein NifW [Okeania sp. SIO1I7]NEN91278.1 nitrogenase-stabilizing/protective protein NifW [Okeania sp. SIO3H1]NET28506.1 nitrogenase-stabilizing/protective protein NifW [Okeania sp. SIO1I7]